MNIDKTAAVIVLDRIWVEAQARINNASKNSSLPDVEREAIIEKAREDQEALDVAVVALDPRHVRRA